MERGLVSGKKHDGTQSTSPPACLQAVQARLADTMNLAEVGEGCRCVVESAYRSSGVEGGAPSG